MNKPIIPAHRDNGTIIIELKATIPAPPNMPISTFAQTTSGYKPGEIKTKTAIRDARMYEKTHNTTKSSAFATTTPEQKPTINEIAYAQLRFCHTEIIVKTAA